MTLDIRIAESGVDRAACLALRREVFIEEQGVDEALEVDGEDDRCTHVLAFDAGVPVGAARYQYPGDYAKIQRVCVPASSRGKGIGADVIRFMIERIASEGQVQKIRLGSQTHAIPFYEKLGFEAFGPIYDDAGIPHRDMEIQLPRS